MKGDLAPLITRREGREPLSEPTMSFLCDELAAARREVQQAVLAHEGELAKEREKFVEFEASIKGIPRPSPDLLQMLKV